MGIFSSKKKAPNPRAITEKDTAILELKRQRIRLVEYKKQAVGVIERETVNAKKLLARGDKKRALLTLKKKKYQQTLIDKTDGQLFNLEELVNSIEFASVQAKVFEALKSGNTVLQKINDSMKIEDVEKLMQESAEAVEHQNKVNELLGHELTAVDMEAVDKELAAFEEADAVKQLPAVPSKPIEVKSQPQPQPVEVQAQAQVVDSKEKDNKEKHRPSLTIPAKLLAGRTELQSPTFVPDTEATTPKEPAHVAVSSTPDPGAKAPKKRALVLS